MPELVHADVKYVNRRAFVLAYEGQRARPVPPAGWRLLDWGIAPAAPGDWLIVADGHDQAVVGDLLDAHGLRLALLVDIATRFSPLADRAEAILLAEDSPATAAAALDAAGALATGVADSREETLKALNILSAEASRIAETLRGLVQAADITPVGVDAGMVRGLVRLRRERERYLPADLFADPVWDMLLDLSLARLEQRLVSVSSLCIAAHVPPSTALRWIRSLTIAGLFVRTADPEDARRSWIGLSDESWSAMNGYFAAVRPLMA